MKSIKNITLLVAISFSSLLLFGCQDSEKINFEKAFSSDAFDNVSILANRSIGIPDYANPDSNTILQAEEGQIDIKIESDNDEEKVYFHKQDGRYQNEETVYLEINNDKKTVYEQNGSAWTLQNYDDYSFVWNYFSKEHILPIANFYENMKYEDGVYFSHLYNYANIFGMDCRYNVNHIEIIDDRVSKLNFEILFYRDNNTDLDFRLIEYELQFLQYGGVEVILPEYEDFSVTEQQWKDALNFVGVTSLTKKFTTTYNVTEYFMDFSGPTYKVLYKSYDKDTLELEEQIYIIQEANSTTCDFYIFNNGVYEFVESVEGYSLIEKYLNYYIYDINDVLLDAYSEAQFLSNEYYAIYDLEHFQFYGPSSSDFLLYFNGQKQLTSLQVNNEWNTHYYLYEFSNYNSTVVEDIDI